MKHLQTVMLICISMLVMVSCKKKNDAGKFIPGNAAFVLVLDGASLNKKLSWDEIKQGELFKEAYSDSTVSAMAKSVMENPENTGLDIKNNITIFAVNDTSGSYAAVTGIVKDATKFKNYITASVKDGTASTKDKIEFVTKDEFTISWSTDRFYMVGKVDGLNGNPMLGGMGMPNETAYDSLGNLIEEKSTMDMNAVAARLYKIEQKNSLAENEKFGEIMSKEGDIRFWANVGALQSQNMGMAAMAMLNVGKLTKDSYYTGVANFEDGKIVLDITSYSGKELTELWKKYEGDDVDTKLIEQSPIKDAAAVIAMNYDPKGLKALLELTGLEGFANLGAGKLGFSVDDFINGQDGKMLLVVGDMAKDSIGSGQPKAFFTVGIKDKVAFSKIINAAKKEAGMIPSSEAEYVVNDKFFTLGTTGTATAFQAGKSKSNYTFLDKLKGGPMGGFINLDYILSSSLSSSSYRTATDSINVAMWDNVSFNGGNFKDGAINQHIEINMKDKKTNSLKQLNTYANKMAIEERKRNSYYDDAVVEEMTVSPDTMTPVISN